MKMQKKALWFMLLAGLLFGLARAEAVTLSYDLKKGDTLRYRELSSAAMKMTGTMSAGNFPLPNFQISSNVVVRDTVTEVTTKGIIIIVRVVESGNITTTMKMSGKQQKSTKPFPKVRTTIKMTADGTVLSVRSVSPTEPTNPTSPNLPGSTSMTNQFMQTAELEAALSRPPLTRNDVNPNDAWSNIVIVPGLLSGAAENLTINSRLLALAPYKGRDCAKIRTSFSLPIDSDLSELMGASPLAQGSTGRLTMKGKVTGTKVWQFDYNKGKDLYAEGTMGIEATTSFQIIAPNGQLTKGDFKINMKANTKRILLEDK
jgi:hypothetical protein